MEDVITNVKVKAFCSKFLLSSSLFKMLTGGIKLSEKTYSFLNIKKNNYLSMEILQNSLIYSRLIRNSVAFTMIDYLITIYLENKF